jgi:hypothetical protein
VGPEQARREFLNSLDLWIDVVFGVVVYCGFLCKAYNTGNLESMGALSSIPSV